MARLGQGGQSQHEFVPFRVAHGRSTLKLNIFFEVAFEPLASQSVLLELTRTIRSWNGERPKKVLLELLSQNNFQSCVI